MPTSSFTPPLGNGALSSSGGSSTPTDASRRCRRLRARSPSSPCLLLAACLLPGAARAFVPLLGRTGDLHSPQPGTRRSLPGIARQSAISAAPPLQPGGCCSGVGSGVGDACRARARDGELPMIFPFYPVATTATAVAATAATISKTVVPLLRWPTVSRVRKPLCNNVGNNPRRALVRRDASPERVVAADSIAASATPRVNSKSGRPLSWQIVIGARKRAYALLRRSAVEAVKAMREAESCSPRRRRLRAAAGVALISVVAFVFPRSRGAAIAAMIPSAGVSGAPAGGGAQQMNLETVAPRLALWFTLFVTSAAFHSAEIAITTLYPWKVKEFAEEEGESSPFQVLNKDITRVLTTILVTTTVCTIYNAALFTNLAIQLFGSAGLAYATAALTVTTLFFGELLPKALGVNNAEVVARRVLPVIILLSVVLSPVAKFFTLVSKLVLSMFGFKSTETGRVSEEELRLIVTGAKMSGGIESREGMMIEGVLDLQDTKICEIMRPRVEVVAIEANSTMMDLYQLHQETKYSRIPVYSGEIDRISGVVLSKDLLAFVQEPEKLSSVLVADETESTYFVPETMSVWNVLEEMRKRRLHMAIVVDEYGGTAGVVTLEDILEEVVGEIYDETEDDDLREEEHYINLNEDGSFTIHGMADLEDVCTSLDFREVSEDDLKEFGTLSGYLCSQAGEIPAVGDYVMVGGYMFTVTKADERRIEEVHAKLLGAQDNLAGGGESEKNQPKPGGGVQIGNGGNKQGTEETVVSGDRSPPASSSDENPSR